MRALVTVCAGFIGSHLTEKLLAKGYLVCGIDCFTNYYSTEIKRANIANSVKDKNFDFTELDISHIQ